MFSIDGLVTGFDTASIIEGLVSFQQSQIQTLNARKSKIATQQAAFKSIEARLLTLRSAGTRLNRITASVFDIKAAQSSDESILTAAASTKAAVGSYTFTVNSLAQAQQIGSQGLNSSSAAVAKGTITLQVGNNEPATIVVDNSNNTLADVAASINNNSQDVSASLIHDQSSDSYRLLLTSKRTGAANQINFTFDPDTGGIDSNPVLDFSSPPIQDAANASITLGSGPGAITAEYETNQIDDLIENVTLNLNSANPDKAVTVSITQDTQPAKDAIQDFVDEFNSLMDFIDSQTSFNSETNQASPLLGNRPVSIVQDRLRNIVIGTVPGLDGNLNRLSQIGVTIDTRGRLSVNSSKLDDALSGKIDGVDASDVQKLFGLNGTSTNPGIQFVSGSTRTKDTADSIQIDILQAAEQASVTATSALADTIVIDDQNNEFEITVDGVSSGVLKLTEGTYTRQELAQQLQLAINASSELGVRDVSVSLSGASLQITSQSYGSSSEIGSISGSAIQTLGFDGSELAKGKDVAGSFIVNGQTETAVGTGRLLVGDPENENTADLQVRVTLDPGSVSSGIEGELTITRGFSGQIDKYLNVFLDPVTGTAKTITEDFESRIGSIDDSIERVQAITQSRREALLIQFANLERVIGELQSTGNFLTAQLASLSTFNRQK